MSIRAGTRLDWWLYRHLCKRRNICPANAHGLLIWRTREDPRIGSVCRRDVAETGSCWCGKSTARGADTPATQEADE